MSTHLQTSTERILFAAERLFAQRGYHGVTTREIAAAAHMNIATVHHHVGRKGELYGRVLQRLLDEEAVMLDEVERELGDAPTGDSGAVLQLMSRFLYAFVDFLAANPLRARLYARCWLDPVDGEDELVPASGSAVTAKLRNVLAAAERQGVLRPAVESELVVRVVPWLVCGHFVGPLEGADWVQASPAQLDECKQVLKEYLSAVLGVHHVGIRASRPVGDSASEVSQ